MLHCELKNTLDTRRFVNDLLQRLGSHRFEVSSSGSIITLKSADNLISAMVNDPWSDGKYTLYVYETGIEELTDDNCGMLDFSNVDTLYHI